MIKAITIAADAIGAFSFGILALALATGIGSRSAREDSTTAATSFGLMILFLLLALMLATFAGITVSS